MTILTADLACSEPDDVCVTRIFHLSPKERIEMIKRRIPAVHVGLLAERMNITRDRLIDILGLSKASLNRRTRTHELLSPDETERVLGVEYLIGQVDNMVRESGDPERFDASKWVATWLELPLPALANRTPASFMDIIEGQKLVSNLLSMVQSGVYA